ncbi:threonine/serine ThrE exporter family protein [Compostimonas suwonensis]|uniref:Uncharacterized membrane protein YjjP (DUF1212 family) n=1 Tax=Compostimonas suwonensis TaxID=1048394 RepID=A0A2M9BB18_9MICO|nr:threonine/serine exporter family protein [Compostimonas suwonensis]PJJ55142.1 uncharacterized membrane protein YjjP (DUF1212 family) [Compostimonas suwonensis]
MPARPRPLSRVTAFVRRLWAGTPKPPPASPDAEVDPAVVSMLGGLGVAMLETSAATNDVEDTLEIIANAYRATGVRVVVLPTLVIIQLPSGTAQRIAVESVSGGSLRLDQAGAIAAIVEKTSRGGIPPEQALSEIAAVRASKPRFGLATSILGNTILTTGFGLVLNPTLAAIPAYVILGLVVGCLIALASRLPTLASALPVLAAFLVTVLTVTLLAGLTGEEPLRVIAPALVSFLPGLTLTIAAVELTSNQVIAGASRLVYGTAQLVLLGFGVYAAVAMTGALTEGSSSPGLGPWSPWVGVALTAIGYVLYSSAPAGSMIWIVLSLYVAFGAQALGSILLSPELSGFVGALVVVPVSRLFARVRSAPPAIVMTLPAFWLLVPGAMGFIGLSESASDLASGGQMLLNTLLSLLSIALGMLVGTGLSRDLSGARELWRRIRTSEIGGKTSGKSGAGKSGADRV